MSQAATARHAASAGLALGPFGYPATYRAIATARSWLDDLLVVVPVTAGAALLELLFDNVRISKFVVDGASKLDRAMLALDAEVWYPAVIAGVVLLACLRLSAHLGREPTLRRIAVFAMAGAASFAGAALELNACPGPWWARFGPLPLAAIALRAALIWRGRTPLRAPTAAGLRPPRRALLTPRGILALADLRVGIPQGGTITTDAVDGAVAGVERTFADRGDSAIEAYAHARAIEHALARGHIVEAEARLERACSDDRLREQPALIGARAALLESVGRYDEAVGLLQQAAQRLKCKPPPALRSQLARARARAGLGAEPVEKAGREWARLAYRGRSGTVLVELVDRIGAAARESPDTALHVAHGALRIVNAVLTHPLIDLSLDEIERAEEARGRALLTIAQICERGRSWQDAANAYLDAVQAFLFVKDRARTAECFVHASTLLLANGKGSAEQESHALDIMRAGLEVLEAERGGLKKGDSRAAWVHNQRSLFRVAFGSLAADLRWHPAKGAELALWLIESLHRTTLAAAARSRLTTSEATLNARLEELTRAEVAQAATHLPVPPIGSQGLSGPPAQRDAEAVSLARQAVIAEFAAARDGALSVNPVDVETLRARLGAGVALLYQCARDYAGWTINCVLAHQNGEIVFRELIETAGADSPCELLDAIAQKRHDRVGRAFAAPMWDVPWVDLASRILPPQLTTVLGDVAETAAELVIVPDGPLSAVPFAGLRLPDGRALLEAARIRMLPSLSLIEERRPDSDEPRRATVVISHLDDGSEASEALLRPTSTAAERASGDRATLERALRTAPPADLVVILAHGQPGSSPFDAAVLLSDSAMSAAAAVRLPWPPAVVLGSCWLGGGDVAVGEEPFGFPIACMISGARTVVGALSPVPPRGVTTMLTHVATELPTAVNLGEAIRRAMIPQPSELEAWRDASAMDWPCITTWSTVALAKASGGEVRPASWDRQGLPRREPVAEDRRAEMRMSRPPSSAVRAIIVQELARRGVVGLAGLLRGLCSADPVCSKLPGADEMAAAAASAPLDSEVPDRVLRLDAHGLPIFLSTSVARALEIAETMACELSLEEVPSPLLVLAATFDECTSTRLAEWPRAERFVDALTDLLECDYEIGLLLGETPSYDAALAERMQAQPQQPPSKALRVARRVGWCTALVALGLLGGGLGRANQLQRVVEGRGFLGVRLASGPDGLPQVVEVLAGTAAAHAGIRVGDVIEVVDGEQVATLQEALSEIDRHRPGQSVRLVAIRGAGQLNVTARLTAPP